MVCREGAEYVKSLSSGCIDILAIDINSGETQDAVICPPKAFLETTFIKIIKDKLRDEGVFITNLLCRSPSIKKQVRASLLITQ